MKFLEDEGKFYLEDTNKKLIAEVTFVKTGEKLYILDHTFVDPSLRGQGVAGKLVKAVVEKARAKGKKIIPLCPYAAKEFQEKEEYNDVWEK